MDLITLVVLSIVAIIAALAAYGSWLIGQDSEAEATAREMTGSSDVASTGWTTIDFIRTAPLPVVEAVEDYLAHLREVAESAVGNESEPVEDDQTD